MTPLTGGGQETAKTINLGVCSRVTGCGQGALFTCHLGLCQAISHSTFCPNGALARVGSEYTQKEERETPVYIPFG